MGKERGEVIFAEIALLPDGWKHRVRIELEGGEIGSIQCDSTIDGYEERHAAIVPAMANLHSHAFQRAMAGLTEIRGPSNDSFWSWRNVMYKMALSMGPDHVEAIAAQLYMEMLEAGFTRVGEFHYLHHDLDGRPYTNIAEMAERIAAATETTGISLTLLPVFYNNSGFGGLAPIEGQRRFINSIDSYGSIMSAVRPILDHLPGAELGVAPHSLRAVTPEELRSILPLGEDGPIHIHIAEQVKEVEDCLKWSGARPVEWLLANAPVDGRWCLIHATHMTSAEARTMAQSGAIAGLCPITEANLGDGIFPASVFLDAGGQVGVGSDSNVQISLNGELRQLEYSQRLGDRARNVIAFPNESTGRRLFEACIEGGAAALKGRTGIVHGSPADLLSLDISAIPYLGGDAILDNWIFAGGVGIDTVWSRGMKKVTAGRHVDRDKINARFLSVMRKLATG